MPSIQDITSFYNHVNLDYLHWSPQLNIHFGYYKSGVNPFNLEAMLVQMNREVLERLQIPRHKQFNVLDAGCGVGATCRFMAAERPEAKFTGTTISSWQVEYGRELNRDAGLTGCIRLMEMDFQEMVFSDHSFDAAFAIESACYAEGADKQNLLDELARVVRPGGRLVIVDGFRKDNGPLPGWLERIYRKYLDLWAVGELANIRLFRDALDRAGFTIVEVEDLRWRTAPTGLHIPFRLLKIWWSRLLRSGKPLSKEQKNYTRALPLTLFLALFSRHFGYYMIMARK